MKSRFKMTISLLLVLAMLAGPLIFALPAVYTSAKTAMHGRRTGSSGEDIIWLIMNRRQSKDA